MGEWARETRICCFSELEKLLAHALLHPAALPTAQQAVGQWHVAVSAHGCDTLSREEMGFSLCFNELKTICVVESSPTCTSVS